ncbi:hypothetical protein Ahy_A06g026138 isoform B [Arachis hypogaea]|uniref:Chlorophyll a-b binding protein, chloroplastic n=1 Tax=Arachis hypogaea TaxID=3818 RepID=A0A445CJJ7_ARAHY|nr:hypothetical protein Ahy_A06g026138 isoform B [Arachis hypogaea]
MSGGTMVLVHPQASPFFVLSSFSSSSFVNGSLQFRRSLSASLTPPRISAREHPCFFCNSSWKELAGVLLFSAFPFAAVKAIANSPLGESLQRKLEKRKKFAVENSSKFMALAQAARNRSFWYGEGRPGWLGPISYEYPSYLTGELPGDYGFDIAGLGKDPDTLQKYFKYVRLRFFIESPFEILHARWAMLASIGALIPEILDLLGAVHFVEPVCCISYPTELTSDNIHFITCILSKVVKIIVTMAFIADVSFFDFDQGDTLDYLGIQGLHLAGSQGVLVIAICQALLMVKPE